MINNIQFIEHYKLIGAIFTSLPMIYLTRKYFQGAQFLKQVSAKNKVCIITGANTGIGKETALELARRGATVYLACRNIERGEAARNDIIKSTGNNNVFNYRLDLASFDSINDFAKSFKQVQSRLDILINNAGLINDERNECKNTGYEETIAVNHLGHFRLTNLLMDILKASPPSRIINVSSFVHKQTTINKNDLFFKNVEYKRDIVYAQSKLANILHARELARLLAGTDVTANSVHPGAVRTELSRNLPNAIKALMFVFSFMMKTPKSGAQTTLAVALDPDFAQITGRYFADCKIAEESMDAKNDELALWLWRKSEELTNSHFIN